jgi:hypothetical protein
MVKTDELLNYGHAVCTHGYHLFKGFCAVCSHGVWASLSEIPVVILVTLEGSDCLW